MKNEDLILNSNKQEVKDIEYVLEKIGKNV